MLQQDDSGTIEHLDYGNLWFAIQARYRHEALITRSLRGKGIEVLYPIYRSRRRWCDRWKEIELPLFSGYLFYRAGPDVPKSMVLNTSGVVRIIGTSKGPSPVSMAEIFALQALVKSRCAAEPCPYIEVGSRVRIMDGPLAHVEGILHGYRNRRHLIVSVRTIHSSVMVDIDAGSVARANTVMMQPLPVRNDDSGAISRISVR